MLIQGPIEAINPPDFTDQYGNQYQNITVSTAAGPVTGRIGSKKPYTAQDIGRAGQWDSEQKQGKQGAYNRFKRHYDTPYQGQQQGQQAPQQPTQRPNAPQGASRDARSTSIERQCAFKAACMKYQGLDITDSEVVKLARAGQYFIETGNNLADVPDYPDEGSQVPPAGGPPYQGGPVDGQVPDGDVPF